MAMNDPDVPYVDTKFLRDRADASRKAKADTDSWIDYALEGFETWDDCGEDDCTHYDSYQRAKARIKQEVIKARIEEVEKMKAAGTTYGFGRDRIAELKQELEEVDAKNTS